MKALTYDMIRDEVRQYLQESTQTLPSLPTDHDTHHFEMLMKKQDQELLTAIRMHVDTVGTAHNHSVDNHFIWVAKLASYVADHECTIRKIEKQDRERLIQTTWRLGLLHDLERWRGYGKEHMIEGSRVARSILDNLGMGDENLVHMVLLHDEMEVDPLGKLSFDIPFFSVFAVDHLNWGIEWMENKWNESEEKGIQPKDAISDYKYMYQLLESPNLKQTHWGRDVALPYIEYGISIAEHIEERFIK